MLYPVKAFLPYQIDAGSTVSFELEEYAVITTKTIFDPVLFFINRSTGLAHFKVVWCLDAGQGNDPLNSGTFQYVTVDDDLDAGKILSYDFLGNNLEVYDEPVASRHSIYIENKSTATQIYWVILTGRADTKAQLPADREIITNQEI